MKGTTGNAEKMADIDKLVGRFSCHIELETCRDVSISRPRVRHSASFSPDTRVEFSRTLRETFPVDTRFIATLNVCQKDVGKPYGPPYVKACDVAVIAASVSDPGLMAKSARRSDP